MANSFLSITTVSFYLAAIALQLLNLLDKQRIKKSLILLIGFIAMSAHAWLLHRWIDIAVGQNLTFLNVFSLITWLVALLVAIAAMCKPVENLLIIIFPISILSIGLVIIFPGNYVINTGATPKLLIHILISLLALSVLCIAALQAILLAVQENQLRRNKHCPLIKKFPPLETMELLLFQMIRIGLALLSVVLATSVWFFSQAFAPPLLQKTLLVGIAWIIFAMLLFGRYFFGWRGRVAIYWTLGGVMLLIFAYFGSRFLVELLI